MTKIKIPPPKPISRGTWVRGLLDPATHQKLYAIKLKITHDGDSTKIEDVAMECIKAGVGTVAKKYGV